MGILIAIDGTDASGKQTQSELLYKRLTDNGIKARLISFPAYENASSALVKMYLAGDFGKDPSDVNAYAASVFYAADRFATYRTDWGKDYNDGVVIIADRYVSSNMIHQASKCADNAEKDKFIAWLEELEYGHFGLPRPDKVLFLDMPTERRRSLCRIGRTRSTISKARTSTKATLPILKRAMRTRNISPICAAGRTFPVSEAAA